MSETIGLTGPAGCGKDTVANMLYRDFGYDIFAFADPLKQGIATMLQIPIGDFFDREAKEIPNDYWKKSPRELAQTCGTEWARTHVAADCWIRRLAIDKAFVKSERRVVVDVRFDNESDWIRDQGGELWHIRRSNVQSVRPHVSESGVRFRSGDVIFDNNGDLESCAREIARILEWE